jgi:hypothetical protein
MEVVIRYRESERRRAGCAPSEIDTGLRVDTGDLQLGA